MVRIRMRRVGSKHQPSYRIIAADKESPAQGRFLEILGHYNPRTEPATVKIDETRLFHWLKRGAQPSESVVQALRPIGTWERYERYKQGEPLEKLLEEAQAAMPVVDPRTRVVGAPGKRLSKKARAREAGEIEAASVAQAAPSTEMVAQAPVEAPEPAVDLPEAEEPEVEAAGVLPVEEQPPADDDQPSEPPADLMAAEDENQDEPADEPPQ